MKRLLIWLAALLGLDCTLMDTPATSRRKLKRMPWRRWPLGFSGSFSNEEVAAMQRGFQPRDMDDRWLVLSVHDWVYVHRTWTGSCIYALQLCATPQGWTVGRSWVNRNRREYRGFPIKEERDLCRSLIERLLLNLHDRPHA